MALRWHATVTCSPGAVPTAWCCRRSSCSASPVFQLPGLVSSATRVPSGWLGRTDSLILLCSDGQMFAAELDGRIFDPWSPSPEKIVAAAGFGTTGTLAFTGDGNMLVYDGELLRRAFMGLLHGRLGVQQVERSMVLVYAADDAWYVIDVSDGGGPEVVRFLMTEQALVAQVVSDSDTTPVRATPHLSTMSPSIRNCAERISPYRVEWSPSCSTTGWPFPRATLP